MGSPRSTLLSAPPVYQAKFAGWLRRSAPTLCPSISSRRLRSLDSRLTSARSLRSLVSTLRTGGLRLSARSSLAAFTCQQRFGRLRLASLSAFGLGEFCSGCGDELVEGGVFEFVFCERLLGSVCDCGCLGFWDEGDRAAPESCAGEAGSDGAVSFRRFHEGV